MADDRSWLVLLPQLLDVDVGFPLPRLVGVDGGIGRRIDVEVLGAGERSTVRIDGQELLLIVELIYT